jgi:hypothetical protein
MAFMANPFCEFIQPQRREERKAERRQAVLWYYGTEAVFRKIIPTDHSNYKYEIGRKNTDKRSNIQRKR